MIQKFENITELSLKKKDSETQEEYSNRLNEMGEVCIGKAKLKSFNSKTEIYSFKIKISEIYRNYFSKDMLVFLENDLWFIDINTYSSDYMKDSSFSIEEIPLFIQFTLTKNDSLYPRYMKVANTLIYRLSSFLLLQIVFFVLHINIL